MFLLSAVHNFPKFLVVAEAVRNLAQRSAESAKNIATLIDLSVTRIGNSAEQANRSGEVLAEIVNSVKKVSDLNGEIATASEEQSSGILQISRAMNQLDGVTQGNAAASEEAAATAEELSAQSSVLLKNVASLNGLVSGDGRVEVQVQSNGHVMERNVIKLKKVTKPPVKGEEMIPFDDDQETHRKLGTTDGF